jgi:transposase InsO family protein
MITSNLGAQFTSNIWSQLCEMLHISHRQTTAYHPESNGAVERLHRCLKDAFYTRASAATWSEELPFVLLGSVHSQGKTLVFPRLRQFLALQLSSPTNFCKKTNFLLMRLSKNKKNFGCSCFFLAQAQLE